MKRNFLAISVLLAILASLVPTTVLAAPPAQNPYAGAWQNAWQAQQYWGQLDGPYPFADAAALAAGGIVGYCASGGCQPPDYGYGQIQPGPVPTPPQWEPTPTGTPAAPCWMPDHCQDLAEGGRRYNAWQAAANAGTPEAAYFNPANGAYAGYYPNAVYPTSNGGGQGVTIIYHPDPRMIDMSTALRGQMTATQLQGWGQICTNGPCPFIGPR